MQIIIIPRDPLTGSEPDLSHADLLIAQVNPIDRYKSGIPAMRDTLAPAIAISIALTDVVSVVVSIWRLTNAEHLVECYWSTSFTSQLNRIFLATDDVQCKAVSRFLLLEVPRNRKLAGIEA